VAATLQTIADALGVSRSTVSNAYSRPDQLSPALREKILQTAKALGYSGPNPTARSLRRGRVGAVGVLFTGSLTQAFTDPYAVQFLGGLAQATERRGTGLLLIPLSPDDPDGTQRALSEAAVDGFCIYCAPNWQGSLAVINSRGLPVVTTENPAEAGAATLVVSIDERAASRTIGEHVVGFGHRRIAVLDTWVTTERRNGPVRLADPESLPFYISRERICGVRDAVVAGGGSWSDVLVLNARDNTRADGAAAAAHALDRAQRCTAILATSDVLALGVLDAMAARGLRPGHDVSVTGFDDIPDAERRGLTTIHQPSTEKGRVAGELLLDAPEDPAERRKILPTSLVVRSSTGPAPVRSSS
jgi:DNA-binding LacI/PurR family transcriptional regulator